MNYIEIFKRSIADIERLTKGGLPRNERMRMIDDASKLYAFKHSELVHKLQQEENEAADRENRKPRELPINYLDSQLLDKMADLILYEELTDTSSNKSTKYEYPILSEYQLARRREGSHEQTGILQKGEVPLSAASNVAQDGRDYRFPKRKKKTILDEIRHDNATLSRNKERKRKYNDFVKPQPVITYKAGDVQ